MPDLTEAGAEPRSDFYAGLPAGTRLGQYELKSILGQGAFGITYRARDIAGDRDVAIKEYLPATLALRKDRTTVIPRSGDLAEQFAWGRERFLEEANTLKRLEGTSSIVQVHDFLEAHGTAYMVMALIEGETMAKRVLREQRLTAEALERILFPLLDGLEKVHAAGFLHRDIKPANIMIDLKGSPTLIDFGASRAALAGRSTTFTAIFTPGYAAAEQFASSNLGPWTDIYGLAATFYHAISGQIPPSAIERMFKDEYRPLVELHPLGFSPAFLEAIDWALAVTSADRPRSIAEWRQTLASSLDLTRIARRPGRLARAVSKTRRKRLNIGAPAIGLISVAVLAAVGGIGYVAFTASAPPTVSVAALGLSAEQLEQALAERRKADAQAADMARREDEARHQAQAEAEAKRQADEQLEQTRQARQKAEQELAELNARLAEQRRTNADQANRAVEEAAQRKAEQEARDLAAAEERAAKQAAAEAEAKRQADEALARVEAERRQAEEAARAKAEAEQAALRQASEDARRKAMEAESVRQAEQARLKAEAEREKAHAERLKAEAEGKAKAEAETAEKALRLEQADRQRLQVALTSLGFDTRGSDGAFGPRSREMIAGWQRKAGAPATGFLTAAQRDQLLRAAAPAVTRWEQEQKKIEDEKTRADAAKVSAAVPSTATSALPPPTPPSAIGQPANSAYDGAYGGDVSIRGGQNNIQRLIASLRVIDGRGSGSLTTTGCSPSTFSVTVLPAGKVTGEGYLNCIVGIAGMGATGDLKIDGKFEGKSLALNFQSARGGFLISLSPGRVAAPSVQSPDGLWRGTYTCGEGGGQWSGMTRPFTIDLTLKIDGSTSSGGGFSPSIANGRTINVEVSVSQNTVTVARNWMGMHQHSQKSFLKGQLDGNTIRASGKEHLSNRDCTLSLSRIP